MSFIKYMTSATSPYRNHYRSNILLIAISLLFAGVWVWALINTTNTHNWLLENSTVFVFLALLAITYVYFKFSDISYMMFFLFLLLHIYGSQHVYAQNPLGKWLQDQIGLDRNPYDRIVHFSFGLLMAYPMRELCLRYIKSSDTLAWILPVVFSLALGGFYEVIEWALVLTVPPEKAADFLGMQGDMWDAQKDIVLAFVGSFCGVTLISIGKKIAFTKKYQGTHNLMPYLNRSSDSQT